MEEDYYEILEVAESATIQEIKKKYYRLMKEYHTDGIPSHRSGAIKLITERLAQINEAYKVLSDPAKRREYDELLKEHRKSGATPSTHENNESSTTSSDDIPKLEVSQRHFDFSNIEVGSLASGNFTISNIGDGILNGSITANVPWIKVSALIAPITQNQSQRIQFAIDTNSMAHGFSGTGTISIKTNGGDIGISVSLSTEGLSVLTEQFIKSYVPLIAACAGLIGSFIGNSPVINFFFGAFFVGLIPLVFAKPLVKHFLKEGIDIFTFHPVLIQCAAAGVVILTIFAHYGGSGVKTASYTPPAKKRSAYTPPAVPYSAPAPAPEPANIPAPAPETPKFIPPSQVVLRILNQNCLTGDFYMDNIRVAIVPPNTYQELMVDMRTYTVRTCNPNTSNCTPNATVTISAPTTLTINRMPSCNSGNVYGNNQKCIQFNNQTICE